MMQTHASFCSPTSLGTFPSASHSSKLCERRGRPVHSRIFLCASFPKSAQDPATRPRVRVSRSDDAAALAAAQRVWAEALDEFGIPTLDEDATRELGAHDSVAVAWLGGQPVGAGRVIEESGNARLELVYVLSAWRGQGAGRALADALIGTARRSPGATYVRARAVELGFYSLLGFEAQGPEVPVGLRGATGRVMVLRVPECAPSAGCVGLHHTSMRVCDIERALAFYGVLGFVVTEKFVTAAGGRACFVEGLGVRLEFVESANAAVDTVDGVPPFPAAGFDRLVFDVTRACTDLETYIAHLKRRNGGILTVRGAPATQVSGKYVVSVATIEDPDGIPIEFIRRQASVPSALRTRVNW